MRAVAEAEPGIVSIDLNPLIVSGRDGTPVAVDALVELADVDGNAAGFGTSAAGLSRVHAIAMPVTAIATARPEMPPPTMTMRDIS